MGQEFSILFKRVERLKKRYTMVDGASKIFDELNNSINEKKVGKRKSKKNLATANRFNYFFSITREAMRNYIIIEVAKFFDNSKKSLSVYKIINYSTSHISKLTIDDFKLFHSKRKIIPKLFKDYKEINFEDLHKINKRILRKKDLIKKFKDYRDVYSAHDDLKKIDIQINNKEVKQILRLLRSIIEYYYLKLDFASNIYINFLEEPVKEIKYLFKSLNEHEEERIKKIMEEYKI